MAADWTFMVYMAGYNNLSSAAGTDLKEMRKVGSTDRVKVCVFVKQQPEKVARHIVIGKNGKNEQTENLGDKDSGSPQTVVDFVRWARKVAPAQKYALVLWNHGSGWEPQDFDQLHQEVRGDGFDDAFARESEVRADQLIARSLFTTTLREFVSLDPGDRAICSDDGSGHSLDTVELGRVLAAIEKDAGGDVELLGMDACLMSNLEVAFEARGNARTIVGSEELEPNAGWPYDPILAELNEKPEMDGPALGSLIVDKYIAAYKSSDREWPVTQCAVATSGIDAFAKTLDGLSAALLDQARRDYRPIQQSQSRAVRFEMQLRDLKTFCEALAASSAGAPVKQAAKAVLDGLKPGGYVLREGHLGSKVQECGGVTVFLPVPGEPISQYYKHLRFAADHGWDEFLHGYAAAVRGE
jgi:hypothetical protein